MRIPLPFMLPLAYAPCSDLQRGPDRPGMAVYTGKVTPPDAQTLRRSVVVPRFAIEGGAVVLVSYLAREMGGQTGLDVATVACALVINSGLHRIKGLDVAVDRRGRVTFQVEFDVG